MVEVRDEQQPAKTAPSNFKGIQNRRDQRPKTVIIGGTSESNALGAVTSVNIETKESGEAGESNEAGLPCTYIDLDR